MKLTKNKLVEIIGKKNKGWTTYQVRKIAGISIRRVNQVYKQYLLSEQIPEIGKTNGRPARTIEDWEIQTVKEAFEKYSVSASMLMKLIERDYGNHINHNRIHRILLGLGMAKKKGKKDIRKKDWIRYERRHSLTAVHIDWYYCSRKQLWVFAVIDDASRKLLALVECNSPTTEASIEGMKLAMKHGKILQCISDHGSQFISNIGGDSRFKEFLDENEIQQILCRIKHPQSNGKVEKFFDLYQNKRSLFKTREDFIVWYNEIRPHRSLNFEVLETPQQAFIRKMKAEV
ncbi:MAG: DDE-type integrase/transposase/recombinase [Thermoproteota archaeon]